MLTLRYFRTNVFTPQRWPPHFPTATTHVTADTTHETSRIDIPSVRGPSPITSVRGTTPHSSTAPRSTISRLSVSSGPPHGQPRRLPCRHSARCSAHDTAHAHKHQHKDTQIARARAHKHPHHTNDKHVMSGYRLPFLADSNLNAPRALARGHHPAVLSSSTRIDYTCMRAVHTSFATALQG